ncbi:hypothetical protein HOY82DRAFT_671181 [Tuber indicum]|nr:hypothetical protein HOY82DRAFT_671181 [Tuber indicum]
MNPILARNIPHITTRLRMGLGGVFHKRRYATSKGKMGEDQSSLNTGHVTWERFLDHQTQNTNRFSAIEKHVAVLGGLSEAVKKLSDKVEKLEGKIHTEFKTLGSKIEKHDGMMQVSWGLLLVPITIVCGKIAYDYYVGWGGGSEEK